MRLFRSTKPIFLVVMLGLVLAVLFGAVISGKIDSIFMAHDNSVAKVTLRDFAPGTQVNYRITSEARLIAQKQAQVDDSGVLSLPVEKEALAGIPQVGTINYELDVTGSKKESAPENLDRNPDEDVAQTKVQNPADILKIMLALNPKEKKIDVLASGLEDYANVILKQAGEKEEVLSADWAGLFSATLDGAGKEGALSGPELQLAFQNAGIHSDLLLNQMGMPRIEVQTGVSLGDSSRHTNLNHWAAVIIRMTEQFSAVMVQQTKIIGMFIDASIQLETQRKLQELQARAHKDYHPSEQMCRFGSYIKSVARAESKADLEKTAMNKYLMEEYLGVQHVASGGGPSVYEGIKIKNYLDYYCDTADNGSAAGAICDAVTGTTTAEELARHNKDIDYTRTVGVPLTLDINFTDGTASADEEDVLALARYLYFPTAFNISEGEQIADDIRPHYESRSYAAKMGVAHNSFISIVGMKASAPEGQTTTTTTSSPTVAPFATGSPIEETGALQTPLLTTRGAPTVLAEDSGWAYMKAMLRDEFGLAVADIDEILGERPSYYAQMEVLTKKIYQNPDFYTNLYDKPANVKRIGATLDAILLMSQRDRFESLMRREMLSAVLIENTLLEEVNDVNSAMFEQMQESQFGR